MSTKEIIKKGVGEEAKRDTAAAARNPFRGAKVSVLKQVPSKSPQLYLSM